MSKSRGPQFVGRERERSALENFLADAKEGHGGMVLLAGEAGIGKTTLAEQSLAEQNFETFVGRASEDAAAPYGPIVSALRDCLRRTPEKPVDCGKWTPYLAVLLPELGVPPEEADRETLGEAIASALTAASHQRPAAFLLDDLHWADSATLEILPSLAERIRGEGTVILGTYRNEEIPRGHRLRWLRNELRRRRLLNEIVLPRFTAEETAAFLTSLLDTTPTSNLARTVHDKTHGNPFFIEELARTLATARTASSSPESAAPLRAEESLPIPESLRDALLVRMEDLSEPARATLEVAAVAGTEFELDLLCTVSGGDEGFEDCIERNFLVEMPGGRAAFRHALTRDAVRHEIPWRRRRALHRDVAEYLERAGASSERRAEQWLGADDHGRAREALLESAENSCHVHAFWDAAHFARRALDIWPENDESESRLDVLERLAHCAQVSGQLIVAADALETLLRMKSVRQAPERYARAQRSRATILGIQGKLPDSLRARQEARKAFEEADLFSEAAVEAMLVARTHLRMFQRTEAQTWADEAVDLARASGREDLIARALALQGYVMASRGKYEEGKAIVDEGLAIALDQNRPEVAAEVYRRMGSVLEFAAEFTGARDVYLGLMNRCRRKETEAVAHDCMGCLAWILFRTGEWKRSLAISREVKKLSDAPFSSQVAAMGTMAMIQTLRGEVRPARRLIHTAEELVRAPGAGVMVFMMEWIHAVLAEIEGAREEAREHYCRFLNIWRETDDRHDAIGGLTWASSFFSSIGAESEASRCTEGLAMIATETGNAEALAGLACALGESALLKGRPDTAARQFLQAVEQLRPLDTPFDLARAEYRAGVALRKSGENDEAIRFLTNAYRRLKKLGARPIAAWASTELLSLGEQADERQGPKSEVQEKRGGLTRRQMEILRLIAAGLSNKEIAARLYLSPRTVEMHAAQVLARLNCRSRSEAVHKAGQLGLVD